MLKSLPCTLAILFSLSPTLQAGVIVEMSSRDPGSDEVRPADTVYAQGGMLRLERGGEDAPTMIFREGALLILNPSERSFYRMDENSMVQMNSRMSEAMKQMQEQMAKLPPEQRAMMEKMMKGRMPEAMAAPAGSAALPLRLEPTGRQEVSGYSCRMWQVFRGEEKIRELCTVPVDELASIAEAMDSFQAMARFSEKMTEALQQGPMGNLAQNPYQFMDRMEGFPVMTREFRNGEAVSEVLLKSVTRETLDGALFEVPSGYREMDAFSRNEGR